MKRVASSVQPGPPEHRLRHDRDQRLRAAELRRRLRAAPDEHRAGHADPRARRPRRRAAASLPIGERGEIWFKGPNLIRGYWNRPEATAETIVDGWLRTGDLGRLDDEGFVYVEDRAKDMILRAGENVYCAEVEAAIYEHPAVHEAAVFGVPHERLGEEVAAAVCRRPGTTDRPRRAAGARRERRSRRSRCRPGCSSSTEPLPRNAAGKILKRELRDQVASEG